MKRFPSELADIAVESPCIPVDGYLFIWTSIINLCKYNTIEQKAPIRILIIKKSHDNDDEE